MANVRLLSRAEADLEAAIAWYESYSSRAARRFENAVTAALERIAAHPQMYALVDDRHRICRVRRSRYLTVYRFDVATDEVLVIAVPHGSQEPGAWRS
jgi:plasmid stabilization system protein ParE